MPPAQTSVSEFDLLCESCGYALINLPRNGRCPECGELISSSLPELRQPAPWEQTPKPQLGAFIRTCLAVIFVPTRFFRSLAVAPPMDRSRSFALLCAAGISLLLGFVGRLHLNWLGTLANGQPIWAKVPWELVSLALSLAIFVSIVGTVRLAGWLTHLEANYRGYRMPLPVVARGLRYHSAHAMGPALLMSAIIAGYWELTEYRQIGPTHDVQYLYVLAGAAILSAIYLFLTYWTAMRNLLYANRSPRDEQR